MTPHIDTLSETHLTFTNEEAAVLAHGVREQLLRLRVFRRKVTMPGEPAFAREILPKNHGSASSVRLGAMKALGTWPRTEVTAFSTRLQSSSFWINFSRSSLRSSSSLSQPATVRCHHKSVTMHAWCVVVQGNVVVLGVGHVVDAERRVALRQREELEPPNETGLGRQHLGHLQGGVRREGVKSKAELTLMDVLPIRTTLLASQTETWRIWLMWFCAL